MLHKINEFLPQLLIHLFGSRNERLIKDMTPIVEKIEALESFYSRLSDKEMKMKKEEFVKRYASGETLDELLPEVFASVREAARRVLGMRHFGVQLLGGIVLHQGKIAEMVTGEGKTLVATLSATLNAISGNGVYIVTVNDYLARRDRAWMGPIYEFLGFTVGCIQSEMHSLERIPEYKCDITYGTNNEFGFDYLRDNMKVNPAEQCQTKLYYAIVDEVDSVLIDEARTPLIISGPSEESSEKYYKAKHVADRLHRDMDYEVKEKELQVILTDEGLERAEKATGVDSFYKGRNMDWPHYIEQALRAKELFKKDREYIVKDNEILIVDEFTGRLMPGRRWSDGLHQAIEAKEGLKIQEENQTLATITFQNFFRLFKKLCGMTGTALTEAMEFDKIYNLDVIVIPTNRPLIRISHDDVIYRSEREKFDSIVEEIWQVHRTGRPILVGTISIEKSEIISEMLKRRGVEHEVLNAKHHEREALIIAKAGQLGNVTIATNMAGRGTDIILGTFTEEDLINHWVKFGLAPKKLSTSDSDFHKKLIYHWGRVFLGADKDEIEKTPINEIEDDLKDYWKERGIWPIRLCRSVSEMGGLYIIGTERHDARRIDNQLRGRAGRQGDPGSSRFFLSLEDDLMRKFAPPTIKSILEKLGLRDGQDIHHPMISRAIEKAQRKVEAFNFDIRKSLLEYDEVMNEQRKIVYNQRQDVLFGKDLKNMISEMIEERIETALDTYLPRDSPRSTWDLEGLCGWGNYKFRLNLMPEGFKGKDDDVIKESLSEEVKKTYDTREKELGEKEMRELERFVLLETIDSKWKDHLRVMDMLKGGINLEAYAGRDPKIEYKRRGYQLFDELINSIQEEVTELIFKLEFERSDMNLLENLWNPSAYSHKEFEGHKTPEEENKAPEAPKPIKREEPKVGRNSPCPCGSGKKYKKCCGKSTSDGDKD